MKWRMLSGIAVILLLALAWTGVSGGFSQLDEARTIGQELQTVSQFLYGALSVVAIVTRFWVPHWNRRVLIAWAESLGLAGGLAPVVWGDANILVGLVAGIATLLVAWGIAWMLRQGSSPRPGS